MIPLLQREIASNGWLNASKFANIIAISEMTPGPIAVNSATFVGYHAAGVLGGIIATLGVASPSVILILIVANIFFKYKDHPLNTSIFYIIRPIIAALILTAAFFVAKTSIINTETSTIFNGWIAKLLEIINFKSLLILIISLFAYIKFKLHPILVIAISGILGILFFYLL